MRLTLLIAVLALSGCSLPSGWNPFGTPVSRAEKAQAKVEAAAGRAELALQEEVHKADAAVDLALGGNPHALGVAKQHTGVAKNLADQIFGVPTVASESKWQDIIRRSTSLDDRVREIAEKENAKRAGQIADLSADLEKKNKALDAAEKKALDYAGELQSFKDRVLKVGYVIAALFVLYFLGQILQFLAHFNPAFETAANAVNAFVSPAMHSAAYKARKALAKAATPSEPAP